MLIRAEKEQDQAKVRAVLVSAFETSAEADLVDVLREQVTPIVSLVAEAGGVADGGAAAGSRGEVVGHILFSPVSLSGHSDLAVMGLGPMAVRPDHQRQSIGSALVRAGLERCKELGFKAVVVLGHPAFYPRFGFMPSVRFGINSEYEVPEEVFMVTELQPNAFDGRSGRIHYHAAFAGV